MDLDGQEGQACPGTLSFLQLEGEMATCSSIPEERWVNERFEERCYFYPDRDCPGWNEGGMCGRILEPIPEDVTKEGED